jgi:hypothetical protein
MEFLFWRGAGSNTRETCPSRKAFGLQPTAEGTFRYQILLLSANNSHGLRWGASALYLVVGLEGTNKGDEQASSNNLHLLDQPYLNPEGIARFCKARVWISNHPKRRTTREIADYSAMDAKHLYYFSHHQKS